jgi:hypothetical protein
MLMIRRMTMLHGTPRSHEAKTFLHGLQMKRSLNGALAGLSFLTLTRCDLPHNGALSCMSCTPP